jgi:hypothetical protein
MGYGILMVVYGTIFWYVINFTSVFGWKVSWIWWYCGIFAIFLQFLVLDPLIAVAHYFIHKFNKRLGELLMMLRTVK